MTTHTKRKPRTKTLKKKRNHNKPVEINTSDKNVIGPDGNKYYGIVAPQYITKNGLRTKNRQARSSVWRGDYYRTKAGLTKDDLAKNPDGKIVSKRKQTMMKKNKSWKKYFGKRRAKTFKKKKTKN